MVISGVAEQMADKINSIVFLDAFVPDNGDALADLTGKATLDLLRTATQKGDIAIPARSAASFNVNEKDRAWVDALCGPQPIATFVDKIALSGARERISRRTYIRAANNANPGFDKAMARAKADPSWRTYEVACGHDVMVDMPERLAEILIEVA
jgi:hypothetical protein